MAMPVSLSDAADVAKNGSPMLLATAGRLLGLGAEERSALFAGKIPWWTWILAGAAAGFFGGARVTTRWPQKVPGWVKG